MIPPTITCPHCGAQAPPPTEALATFVRCAYCGATIPLSAEWIEARHRHHAAIDRQRHETAEREQQARAKRRERLIWMLGMGGLFLVVAVFVAITLGIELFRQHDKRQQAEAEQAERTRLSALHLSELKPRLAALAERGCTHEVQAPRATVGDVQSTLTMKAGGNCLHAVVAGHGQLEARIVSPSGKVTTTRGPGAVDFEHCAAETGEHRFSVDAADQAVVAVALVDCPPPFEKHKDDPEKNGLARVQRRLASLRKAGCRRVIMPPKAVTGPRSLTAKMTLGPFCTVLIAAAGSESNPLTVSIESPVGQVVESPPPEGEIELVHCAKVAGDHEVTVTPKILDYYTLAGMDCPRWVAAKRGAR